MQGALPSQPAGQGAPLRHQLIRFQAGGVISRGAPVPPSAININDLRAGGGTPTPPITMKDVMLTHLQTITEMLPNPPVLQ